REERFLMRQRGAGTRDIVLAFDLELPGLPPPSKTPLKPQKSSRLRTSSPAKLLSLRSTRKTPRSAKSITSLAKHVPATSQRRKTRGAVEEGDGSNKEVSYDKEGFGGPQHNGGGIPMKKRKAMEDISEIQTTARPRKKRKRKSIGQQSSRRKTRVSSAPMGTAGLPNLASTSRKSRQVGTEHLEVIVEPEAVANKNSGSRGLHDDDDEEKKAQMPGRLAEKKQKSIKQVQRTKQKPIAIQQEIPTEPAEMAEKLEEPAKAESLIEHVAADNKIEAKPRKRKRKAIAQSPPKRRKLPPPKPVPDVLKEKKEKSENATKETTLGSPSGATTTKEKPAGRGRKPRPVPKEQPQLLEVISASVPEAPKFEETYVGVPHTEVYPQFSENIPVPKRKRKKRKSIGQIQRPRKKKVIEPATECLSVTKFRQPEVEVIDQSEIPAPVPGVKGRCRTKKLPVSPTESPKGNAPPLQVPKKRGRPMRVAPSARAAVSVEAIGQPIEHDDPNKSSQKSLINDAITVISSIEPMASVRGQDSEVAPQQAGTEPSPIVKKRGRPKKQAPATLLTEVKSRNFETHQPKSKARRRSTARTRAPSTKPSGGPTKPKPEIPSRPIRAATLQGDEDDYDDPLSDIDPSRSKAQTIPNSTHAPGPQNRNLRNKSKTAATVIVATEEPYPLNPKRHTVQTSTEENPLQSHNTVTASLASHLRASRQEEKALHQDLLDLQAQQAHDIAEQKERDLAARLESLSASVKKRKLEARMKVVGDGDRVEERKVSRGLENFVFRTVKRKKVGGEGEDIDPELQELLSRVKGVARRGGRSVVKIF
ncbi:MAG: hypothetical protein Q9225_001548, partial [Loekoesia sp. 1 TL-2023]